MVNRQSQLCRERDRLLQEGRNSEALEIAERVARSYPGRESYFRLGCALRGAGRFREAIRSFRNALRFKTGAQYLVAQTHLQTAYTWYLLREFKRMREALKRTCRMPLKPRADYNIHHALGTHLLSKGRVREALSQFMVTAELAPSAQARGRAQTNIGIAYRHLARFDEAGRYIDKAIRIHEKRGHKADLAHARMARAAIHSDLGNHARALGMIERAAALFATLGKHDQESLASMNAGYLACEMAQWERAKAHLDRAIELCKNAGRRITLLQAEACRSMCWMHLGRYAEAKKDLQDARALLRGRRSPSGEVFLLRAEVRSHEHFGRWSEMRGAAKHGERVAGRLKDYVRISEFKEIRARAEAALGRRRAAWHARTASMRLRSLVQFGASMLEEIRSKASRLANSSVPILIIGESGTGKTDLAKLIHHLSPRARRRWVLIPCDQLTHVTRDVCGHVTGAWSGAVQGSEGMIAGGLGGTVILDRVDELSPEQQQELIPILEGRIRRVGSAHESRIDVRFVATCQSVRKLHAKVLSRLGVGVLQLPPLRERKQELVTLVQELLHNRREISCDAVAELSQRPWNGNLTELRAAIERLVVQSDRWIGRSDVRRILMTPDLNQVTGMPNKTGN